MTGFIETPRFPDEIAAWAVGGRGYRTNVVETWGGDEYRSGQWAQSRGEWDIASALRSAVPNNPFAVPALRNFFRVCKGMLYAFRFKDWTDYLDEGAGVLGTTGLAVAATLSYQMFKNYTISPLTEQQIIQKPVSGKIKVYDNGTLVAFGGGGGQCSLDTTTGIVTFVTQPTVGHALTWTGEFDIPCRFNQDMPTMGRESTGAYFEWQGLKVIEVRNP